MINMNEINKAYESNLESFTKVCGLNVESLQKGVAMQNELITEGVQFATNNLSRASTIKSPKDLESYVVDVTKQVETMTVNNTNKLLDAYKSYVEQLNGIFTSTFKVTSTAVKPAAK